MRAVQGKTVLIERNPLLAESGAYSPYYRASSSYHGETLAVGSPYRSHADL